MKITFKLIDGKPVPHVWTMPKEHKWHDLGPSPDGSDYAIRDEQRDEYNETITHARDNAIPVDERFMDEVKKKCYESQVQKWGNDKTIKHWTPDLTRDYDVDMEFEIREETESCMCTESCGYGLGSYDNCKTLKRTKKVAIPKQTKEVEQKVFCIRDQKRRNTFCSLCECTNTPCNQFAIEPVKKQKEQFYSEELLKDWEKDTEYDEPIKKQLGTILTDSHKLKLLADWFDERDKQVLLSGNEVQDDLRRIAKLLENQPTESGERDNQLQYYKELYQQGIQIIDALNDELEKAKDKILEDKETWQIMQSGIEQLESLGEKVKQLINFKDPTPS